MNSSQKHEHLFSTISQCARISRHQTRLWLPIGALVLASLVACGDDEPDNNVNNVNNVNNTHDGGMDMTDAGDDASDMGPWTPLDRYPIQDGVSDDGRDSTVAAEAGEARVGRIDGDTTFTGTWAHCRSGDFRLYNSRVKFCVQAETTNLQEMFTGGMVVDADLVGSTNDDNFTLFNPRTGINAQFAESVKVIRDGAEGGPAVIRVEGLDYPMAYLIGVIGPNLFRPNDLGLTTEYRLYPDSTELEIVTWVSNDTMISKAVILGDWFGVSDRSETFRQHYGFDTTLRAFDYTLGRSNEGAAFGYRAEVPVKIDELPFSAASPWLLFNHGQMMIESGQELAFRRWMNVGDGRMETLRDYVLDQLEREADRVETKITVNDLAGAPVNGRMVTVSQGEEFLLADRTINGELALKLVPGEYQVDVEAAVGGQVTTQMLTLGSAEGTIEVPTLGTIEATINEGGQGVTAMVKVINADTRAEFFAYRGSGSIQVEPGDYTLVASHGMEYEVVEADVTVTAGASLPWNIELPRAINTDGWIGGDFHQHMESSTDSSVYIQTRIWDNIAEGVDFVASTDHDVVTDLQPFIDELNVGDLLATFPGVEVSPTASHTGVYPVVPDYNARGNGTIPMADWDEDGLVYRKIPDIFAAARAMPNDPIIQLNHARGGSSLFETTSYEPTEDPTTFEHDLWSTDFDVMEIVNRTDETCAIFADWSTFHNVGLKRTGIGNSDTHYLQGDPAGKVRNYMPINKTASDITSADVVDAMKSGQVIVAQNAYMSFTDGRLPSDTITAASGADVTFDVRVQTASWASMTKLFMVVNGSVVQEIDATGTNGFDFDDTVTQQFTQDSWVVFFAWGPSPTTQADHPGPTFSFNNPIFVDVDDNGWTAPGLLALDLDALNVNGWCGE